MLVRARASRAAVCVVFARVAQRSSFWRASLSVRRFRARAPRSGPRFWYVRLRVRRFGARGAARAVFPCAAKCSSFRYVRLGVRRRFGACGEVFVVFARF